jgi:hypothetical protein
VPLAGLVMAARVSHYWLAAVPVTLGLAAALWWFARRDAHEAIETRSSGRAPGVAAPALAAAGLAALLIGNDVLRSRWRFAEGLGYDRLPAHRWVYENVRHSTVQAFGEWRTHLLYGPDFTNHVFMGVPWYAERYHDEEGWLRFLWKTEVDYVVVSNWRAYNKVLGLHRKQFPPMEPHRAYQWAERHPDVFHAKLRYAEPVPNWRPPAEREEQDVYVVYRVDRRALGDYVGLVPGD